MVIVADSGSTKTSWCILQKGTPDIYLNTEGYNPYYMTTDYIKESILANFKPAIAFDQVEEIYFYGAGCSGEKNAVMDEALKSIFVNANISIDSDLIAAAKSVLGETAGFVSILGTGTNSCVFDGQKIVSQVDSLGFLMGDEGSGAYMGKRLLALFGRKALPEELMLSFEETYHISPQQVVDVFYGTKLQNRYSASFTKFISSNLTHPYIQELVKKCFVDFFENIVCLYPDFKSHKLNSVGSIGFTFLSQLTAVAESYGMEIGNIIKSPMDGLIGYHHQKAASQLI